MNFLIKNITPIEGDPDFPQIDVTIDGRPDEIGMYMPVGLTFQVYLRDNVKHPINVVNKLTLIIHNEMHMKLDGPEVLQLRVGDSLKL